MRRIEHSPMTVRTGFGRAALLGLAILFPVLMIVVAVSSGSVLPGGVVALRIGVVVSAALGVGLIFIIPSERGLPTRVKVGGVLLLAVVLLASLGPWFANAGLVVQVLATVIMLGLVAALWMLVRRSVFPVQ